MTENITNSFICSRIMLKDMSELIHMSITDAGDKEFTKLVTQQMSKYHLHEMRMVFTGYFLDFEDYELSPWLLLFSSKDYLSKLQIVINLFGQHLPTNTMGINSTYQILHPLIVSLTTDLNVLSAVIDRIPITAVDMIEQSAELLRDAIDWKSNEQIIPVLIFLYKKNVDLNARSSVRGECALSYATRNERKLTVSWLIEHHVDLNIQDNYGFTALHYAALSKSIPCGDLLQAGANPNIQSNNGLTALVLLFNNNSFLFYSSRILPKEISNYKEMKYSVDINILKEFAKFGAKILFASSMEDPNFKLTALNLQTLNRLNSLKTLSDLFDISVPILHNNYDNSVNIASRERMLFSNRIRQVNITMHRKLLALTIKHGYFYEELRYKMIDADYSDKSDDKTTIEYFLRYFQKPYTGYVFLTLINMIENFVESRSGKLVTQSEYLITKIIEVGSNSIHLDNPMSLYYSSLCLILQLLPACSQIHKPLLKIICRYLEVTIVPYWYKQMQATQGHNDPKNFLCVNIGCWMSSFMYIWHKLIESDRIELERFYIRISSMCEEFQPLVCMTLYITARYYTSDRQREYVSNPDNRYLDSIVNSYNNFIEEIISLLVSLGEDINSPTFYRKQTALLIAVESNSNQQFLKFLLKQGASPYAVDALGYSIKEYCEIGVASKSLHAWINQITAKPYPLQILCTKCLAAHLIYVGNLLPHKGLRKFLIIHT
ncbi:Ankyrin repeat protein [Oopsacas minuta]|uniref:Ankyrin repeat protein n=1 Tax=Oopsacas minuta TaxID=111878 RepID=A0AAV7JPI8_9METZ|nr:Ankyrin repeat protein [Oopsacas minuta]